MRDFSQPRKIKAPRDYFAALRASHRLLSDDEKAILYAEIKRRYAWRDRQRREANPFRLLTIVRVDELERIFLDNYDLHLPDDDAGFDDLTVMAHHLAHFGGSADKIIARIVEWAAMWTKYPTDMVTRLAEQVAAKSQKWKADTLAWRLRLTMAQRTRLKITTIGAIDVKRKDRPAWLREYHRQQKETERRANGMKPRAEYLAGSISAKKSWVAWGVSRRTWERWGKPEYPNVASPADHRSKIRAATLATPTAAAPAAKPKEPRSDEALPLPDGPLSTSRAGGSETLPRPVHEGGVPFETPYRATGHPGARGTVPLTVPHLVRRDGFGLVFNGAPIDPRWASPMRGIAVAVAADKVPFGVLPRSPSWRAAA